MRRTSETNIDLWLSKQFLSYFFLSIGFNSVANLHGLYTNHSNFMEKTNYNATETHIMNENSADLVNETAKLTSFLKTSNASVYNGSDTLENDSATNTLKSKDPAVAFIETKESETEVQRLSPEDLKTRENWGGNCTTKDWNHCKFVKTWFGYYIDEKDSANREKYYEIDCILEPKFCMRNGWTVSRCHLLCMGQCNRCKQKCNRRPFVYFYSNSGDY